MCVGRPTDVQHHSNENNITGLLKPRKEGTKNQPPDGFNVSQVGDDSSL